MKYFAFILLFGLASASLLEIYHDSDEQDFLLKGEKHNDKDYETELGRKLRKTLDHILKEIKKTIQEGKDVSQDLLDQAKDLVHKLKGYGQDVSDEAKDLLDYIKSRMQRWAEELLDILRDHSSAVHKANQKETTELGKKLRELLDHIVDRIKKSVDEGKHISEDLLNKAKQVVKKLKDYGVNVSSDFKSWLEELKDKYSKWAKELLDIIHGKDSKVHKSNEKTEMGKKLRHALERILKRIKQAVEEGKHVSQELIDEAKDLAHKLKEYGLEVSDEIKDMLHYLKERYTRWIKELIDIIRGENSTVYYAEEQEEKPDMEKKLREDFKRIVESIKQTIEEGKHLKQEILDEAKALAQRLRDYGVNVKDEVIDMFHYVKDRYHKWVQDILDIIHGRKPTQ